MPPWYYVLRHPEAKRCRKDIATTSKTISPTDPEGNPSGLSAFDDALATHGFNALPSARPRSLFGVILRGVREPILLLPRSR